MTTTPATTEPSQPRRANPGKRIEVQAGGRDPAQFAPAVEAILLTTDRPVSAGRLAEALRLAPATEPGEADAHATSEPGSPAAAGAAVVRRAIELLNEQYVQTGRAFRIEQVAGGFRVMTMPEFADAVAAFQGARAKAAMTHAALETLAIVAYKQPITRAQLESIRGVACGDILRSLVDRRLVTIAGRAEELGRPILYATTKQFLETFGLSGIKDLPTVDELRARATGEPTA